MGIKLRAVKNLEELIIYSSIEREDEALSYIDRIDDYIEKYTGWNLVEANDSIEGQDYKYVTDTEGHPYIDIDSVRDMLSRGVRVRNVQKIFTEDDINTLKTNLMNSIKAYIYKDNADCSVFVSEDDMVAYGDLSLIIEDVFEDIKNKKEE